MLITEILLETPFDDIAMAKKTEACAWMVSRAIYGGKPSDYEVEIGGHGEFLVWDMASLGVTEKYPDLSKFCLMLTVQNPMAIGVSGAVFNFRSPLFGRFSNGIMVAGLRTLTDEDAKRFVNSTGFVECVRHEFTHAFDGLRHPNMIPKQSDASDQEKYYNDPGEFNAYYHDIAYILTQIATSGPGARDYADIHGFTGDFVRDLEMMTRRDMKTRRFFKWLTDPRHKALLRRLYKLHRHVIELLQTDPAS